MLLEVSFMLLGVSFQHCSLFDFEWKPSFKCCVMSCFIYGFSMFHDRLKDPVKVEFLRHLLPDNIVEVFVRIVYFILSELLDHLKVKGRPRFSPGA